jgi:hypothetical protein
MGCGPKQLELPPAPTYQNSPYFSGGGIGNLYNLGNQTATGNFTGDLSWLQPTINPNNSANALSAAQGLLQPQFRDTLQQINNQAAANNQLNSSTYTDALARSQSDLNSQYQSIVSQQAINDSNQANANRLSLFGTGLNTLNSAIGYGGQSEGAQNSFNLNNYQNQAAVAYQNYANSTNPGFLGNLISSFSPIGHDIYSAQGYNVPGMGTQQSILTAAQLFAGGQGGLGGGGYGLGSGQGVNRLTGLNSYAPGSAATNNLSGPNQYLNYGAQNPWA